MIDAINRAWRIFGTGLSFFVFGLTGLILGVLVFPALQLLVSNGARRQQLARAINHFTFRQFVRLMNGLGLLRYDLVGFDRLERRGLLILANHPSLIDTVFLLGFVRHSNCVVNGQLFRNPFTSGQLRAAGYIRSDSGVAIVDDCVAALEAGDNVLIFPEGTRTPLDGEIHLRRGAANIAVRGGRDVTPIVIRCTPRTLSKGEKWWRVPPRRVQITLEVCNDIPVQPFLEAAAEPALAVRDLTAHLERYFTRESRPHAVV